MTFSIVARCADSGHFGVAVTSSSPAVAARCAFVRAGTGAVASQNVTDPRLGPLVLDAMAAGMPASAAVGKVTDEAENTSWRQLLAVDGHGGTAIFSGDHALGINAEGQDRDAASAGNLLASSEGPSRRGRAGAFVENQALYLMLYVGTKRHYFDKHWDSALETMKTARLSS